MTTPALYTNALERALGRVIADTQRQFEVYVAKSDALIAGLQARVVEVETRCSAMQSAAEKAISDRLASLRNGEDVDMVEVSRRLDEAIAAIPAPKDGLDAKPETIARMVSEAVAALPPPLPGKDADPEVVKSMVSAAVAQVVSDIPAPEMPDIPAMVREAVTAAVSAMEPPQEPDVVTVVAEAVKAAVDALPDPLGASDVSAQIEDALSPIMLAVEQSNAEALELRKSIPEPVDLSGYAMMSALDGVYERVAARLAEQRDFGSDIADAIESVRREIPELPDLTEYAVKADLDAVVERVISNLPVQKDFGPDIADAIESVRREIPDIPEPPDLSEYAKKITLDVASNRIEWVAARIVEQEEALSKSLEALPAIVSETVASAVAALPPAEPGKPGEPADPEAVAELVLARMPTKDELRGPPGRLPTVREWVDEVHYEGTVVTHRGATWQAYRDTGRQPPHSDWVCIAASGDVGPSLVSRGTYDADARYSELDFVMVNGSSFLALRNDPGPCPGDGWRLLASAGGRGKPGDRGEPGKTGDKGPRGTSPVALTVDEDGDAVVLKLDDGTEMVADLYPVLAKLK